MRILVTGGAGFIGSHVVNAYLEAGHQVFVVDNLATGRRENLDPRAELFVMDICDPALQGLLADLRPQVVNHHAAQPSVKVSVDDPLLDARTNVLGLINVLEASRCAGVEKFIYIASGGAMYGEPDYLPVDEDHPIRPMCPYAVTKAVGEHYLRFYEHEYGLRWTSLRYANVYGPRQDPYGEAGVVAIFTEQLLTGQTPVIHWDGEQQKDFVYVGDCARANLLALEGGDGQAYNVGTGRGTSINRLYETLLQVMGLDVTPNRGPKRPGDIRTSYLDCTKIARHLGWRAEINLEEGLRRTVEYFRARHG